jgi:hypothetical protein
MELGQDVDSELGERRDDSNEGIPRHFHTALAANAKHRVFVAWLEKREREQPVIYSTRLLKVLLKTYYIINFYWAIYLLTSTP